MTTRDEFAKVAMDRVGDYLVQKILDAQYKEDYIYRAALSRFAETCFDMADAMMDEKKRREKAEGMWPEGEDEYRYPVPGE